MILKKYIINFSTGCFIDANSMESVEFKYSIIRVKFCLFREAK
jgi:hypothetical protein